MKSRKYVKRGKSVHIDIFNSCLTSCKRFTFSVKPPSGVFMLRRGEENT